MEKRFFRPADTEPLAVVRGEGGAQNVTIRNNRISDANRHIDRRGEFPSAISVGVSLHDGTVGKIGSPIRHILVEGNKFTHIYSNPPHPGVLRGKGVADTQERDE